MAEDDLFLTPSRAEQRVRNVACRAARAPLHSEADTRLATSLLAFDFDVGAVTPALRAAATSATVST
jgi:hypothetical protein